METRRGSAPETEIPPRSTFAGSPLESTSVWTGTAGGAQDAGVVGDRPVGLSGRLAHAPVIGLDFDQALETLEDLARLRSWVDAQEAKVITRVRDLTAERVSTGGPVGIAESLSAAEIGCVLRIPERTAATLLERSQLLTRHYPLTLKALEVGRLSKRHASAVVEEAVGVPQKTTAEFEARLVTLAEGSTVAQFAYKARRLREQLHPETIIVRHTRARRERRVELISDRDGMSWLEAYLPAHQAAAIYQRLDSCARTLQGPDEPRTLTQLRADVLTDVLTHTCVGNAAEGTGFRGIKARVFVTVPVLTLLGGNAPGELEGYGPIDPETARRLAGHAASFTRILVHPETGVRLSVGRTRYKVPRDLHDAVGARDRTCRHPGCNRSAVNGEIDHTIPWSQGGETKYSNLAAMCKRHHMFKTHGYWHYRQPDPGIIMATSLAGKTYTTHPDPPPF